MRLGASRCWALLPLAIAAAGASSSWPRQKPLGVKDGKSGPFTEEFAKLVGETLEKWHVPGLAMSVVDGSDTWSKGYGIATFPSTPVTPDTLFYGASTTKAFLAAALSIMIDSNNYTINSSSPPAQPLAWTSPISTILRDDFVLQDPWATTHLTIADALSHRTGMPRHDKAMSRTYDGHPARIRDIVRSMRHLPLNAEPRTTYQYCNLMFLVLSHVVETLTGQWLGTTLHDWIWGPLGMTSTYFDLDDALAGPEHFAAGYYWDGEAGAFRQVPFMPLEEVSGAGGIVSTAADYAKWMRCWLEESKPLSKEGIAAIKRPQMIQSGETAAFDTPETYASAWATSSYRGHRLWRHSGGMHAYGAEVYFFPEIQFGVATFGNTATTSNAVGEILLWYLVNEKLGIPEDERYGWEDQWKRNLKDVASRVESSLEDMYPHRAKPPLPPARAWEQYTGTYTHPGYGNLTLELVETQGEPNVTTLVAERVDYTWPTLCTFKHVSGEHWMAYFNLLYERGGYFDDFARAHFNVGADGTVESLVIEFRFVYQNLVEGVITFTKVD